MMRSRHIHLFLTAQLFLSMSLPSAGSQGPQPVVLDFENRPRVSSPDGRWYLTVTTGDNTEHWLVLESSRNATPARLFPIQRWCEVLWREDSKAFSVIDARYANHYFLLVDFVEPSGKVESTDLSPLLERTLRAALRGRYDINKIYVRLLRWLPHGKLLARINAVLFKRVRPLPEWQPAEELYCGYVFDVTQPRVVRKVSQHAMRDDYGIDLDKEDW